MAGKASAAGSEIVEAVELGATALAAAQHDISEYAIIRAERLLQPGRTCTGVRCWRLVYKLKRLLPDTPDSEIGKGGELFVEVDLQARRAELVGFGE